jgi:hypothetical protein
MRSLTLLALAACSAPTSRPTLPATTVEEPTNAAPAATVANTMMPVIRPRPAPSSGCTLHWDEVGAPERIELTDTLDEACIPFEDPDLPPHITTQSGRMHGGIAAELTVDGPNGSGRFLSLGLTVKTGTTTRYACMMGSTVGWRHMYPVANQLAPLPFLADVDLDGSAEVVVWDRLPWGDSESDNALFPVVYVLDGDTLVRRDDRAKVLLARVAAAYRTRAQMPEPYDPTACFLAVAQFLDS